MIKSAVIKHFLFLAFSTGTLHVFSQYNPILDNYFIYENSGKVYLSWQIVSGSTCNGIQIFRSTDSLNFYQIGEIPGICGSSSSAVSYNFTDENPVPNKINYFRLELGGYGSSEILSVEFININNGYQIRPSPIVNTSKIYFDNNNNEEYQIFIYDVCGNSIFTSTTQRNYFDFNAGNLLTGIYPFAIKYNDTTKVTGKIIISH